MDSKKKMIIAVSAFALIILAAVVAVFAVLAAQNVTIKSSINVTYTVEDVVADVEVYAVKVKNNASSITWGTAKGTHNFESTYNNAAGETFALGNYSLAKDECVVLKFVFNNNGDKAFTGTLTKPANGTNMSVYYASTESALLASTTTDPTTVSVAAGDSQSGTYFAVIKINDNSKTASFSGTFTWKLA